jgi:type III restriction enzyme
MKLHFEPNLGYQLQAIEAVCDLLRGQEACRTEFTVTMKLPEQQMSLGVPCTPGLPPQPGFNWINTC